MYTPKFNYSDKVVQNLVKIEKTKTQMEAIDLSYSIKNKIQFQNKAIDILHFSNFLGLEFTLKDAEKIVNAGKPENVDEVRGVILKNFKNALDFTRSNVADTYSEFDRPIILHLTKLILSQWRETWEVTFRNFEDRIDDRWDSYVGLRDTNIHSNEIENEMNELIEWYKYSSPTITPIVRIAVVFYRLIEISPFTAGNKFIISSIVDYLMMKHGFGARSNSSVLRMINQNEEKIQKAYDIVRKTYDLSHWIDIFTGMVMTDLGESREEIHEFIIEEEKSKQQPFLNLNKRQLKVLKYLQNVPTIKREDYCHMMDVSTMTAFRDLDDLVRKKLLKIEGRGRGTKYKLSTM
ncbi:Fic family protein [Candidatus Dojkabacteria bacterium]|uniref:Fic family protein n=1 Tax=Candidatus Dojkabacteria bacterium TaxID=2099670 RepID=A0A955RGM9_9BACT|nr:Fic family protein [Candidatus Dojkabacteria bacterium]